MASGSEHLYRYASVLSELIDMTESEHLSMSVKYFASSVSKQP